MTKLVLASVAALGLSAAAASAATITIDDFSTTQGPVSAGPGTSVSDTLAAPAGAIGDRTITSTANGPAGDTSGEIFGSPFNVLSVSNETLASGTVTVSYDLGGLDLTDGGDNDTVVIGINSVDLSGLFSVSVDGVSSSAGISSTGTLNFGFDGFVGADFADVSTLSFTVDSNGVDSLDSSFTFIGIQDLEPNSTVNTVPLPAGALLLGTALLGLGFARRKS